MNQSNRSFRGERGVPPAQPDAGLTDGPVIDMMYLVSVLRVNARLIVLITLAALIGMYLYLLRVDPTYTADTQLVIDTREERVTPAEEIVSNLDVSNAVLASEVVTIRSNVLLGQLVDRLELVDHPVFDPRVPRGEGVFAWLKRVMRRGEPVYETARRLPEETLRSWVIDAIRRQLEVGQIGVSNTIDIRYRNGDPVMAAAVANGLAELYIDSQLDVQLAAATRANAWLAARLEELSAQVEEADDAVVEFRAGMIEQAQGSEESINQLLAELNTRLVASSTERADAEVRLSQMESLLETGGIRAVADVATSPLIENLKRQRAELAAEQAELASTLGRRHPEMIRLSAQLADLDRSMEAELERRLEEMRSEATVTRNREDALQEQIDRVSVRADGLARASVRLDQLERTANATRLVYENFLVRFKETSAQADFQAPQVRVIGRADVPSVPSAPRRTLMMLAALVLGLSGAVIFVFLRNLVRNPVTTVDEVQAISGRPNFAILPYVPHLGRGYRWLHRELSDNPRTTFMERVKSLRLSLLDFSGKKELRTVMITSSVPDEGKSVLSCALARVLRRSKTSVLLLDADLRRPDLRKVLGLPATGACLVEHLETKGNLKDIVQHSERYGFDVISPARPSNDAAELLSSADFANLLRQLTLKYRTIVLNAPPVIYLSDAIVLGQLSDKTLLTVKCGRTSSKVLRGSLARLAAADVEIDGTVLTMVRRIDSAAREANMYEYSY